MDCRGRITQIAKDFMTGEILVTIALKETSVQAIQLLSAIEDLAITMKRFTKKRSLDANAYYWRLTSQLAEAMHVSKNCMHNMNLRKYGQHLIIDGQTVPVVIRDTDEAAEATLEASTYHIKPTSQVKIGNNGKMYRTYTMMKGSSEYDSYEMAALIDGVVDDCKEVGIETLSPDKQREMIEALRQEEARIKERERKKREKAEQRAAG